MEKGNDFVAQAQTGTGKTAAFGLPLLTKVDEALEEVQGMVVAPTRELAKQIGKQLFRYTKYSKRVFCEVLCGGDKIEVQVSTVAEADAGGGGDAGEADGSAKKGGSDLGLREVAGGG